MADELAASDDFRVLRRLRRPAVASPHGDTPTRRGLFVDVETTGLDAVTDEIIEIALVPFLYGLDGQIYEVQEPFEGLRDPGMDIPPAITAITGITNAMVAEKRLDLDTVAGMAESADLVIAHNAAFDRKFVERLCGEFSPKPWACSMSEIDWKSEGYEGVKLAYLAMGAGFFYDSHRAANDCLAAIELLAAPLRSTGKPAMERLLTSARRTTWRIWAEGAPFARKDELKVRGYRWNGDGDGGLKCWYIDVDDASRQAELDFLRTEIYSRNIAPKMRKLAAYDRFSSRQGAGDQST